MPIDEHRLARLETTVDKHSHLLTGNGAPGMDEVLRTNTKRLETLDERMDELGDDLTQLSATVDNRITEVKQSVDALRRERQADADKRAGAKSAVDWIRFALQLLAIVVSLAIGFTQLQANFANVTQQLNRIPPLPE